MKPASGRPANVIGRTCGSPSACSRASCPTRTMSAMPVTPQHMTPFTLNDNPPTIRFSTTPGRPARSCLTRSAVALS
jgi:hypothetical protein